MKRFDVIVVGAGGIGSAAVHQLAQRGLSVLAIDRFRPPHTRGSTHGGTRLIRRAYFEDTRLIPLLARSYELWADLERATGHRLYHRTGFLVMSTGPAGVAARVLDVAREHGIALETLGAPELRWRFPQFRVGDDVYGLLELDAGFLAVEDCVRAHLDAAAKAGARLAFDEPVESWSSDGGHVKVRTARAQYTADRLVLAPGAWSPALLPGLDVELTVRRGPQFWFDATPKHEEAAGMPCFAFVEEGQFVYGFPSIGGQMKIASYTPGTTIEDPLAVRPMYSPEELAPVASVVNRRLPGIEPVPSGWNICMFTLTRDENFILDRHPSHANVWIFTGESGHAFKFAPLLGEVLAQLVTGEKPAFDLGFLALRR